MYEENTEQDKLCQEFTIPLGAGELSYRPKGSTYKDLNEKSPTYGQDKTREKATLVYTHGKQRFSMARVDVEGLQKAFSSSKVLRAIKTLPAVDTLEE